MASDNLLKPIGRKRSDSTPKLSSVQSMIATSMVDLMVTVTIFTCIGALDVPQATQC
jgi:hypothetical protein